MTPRDIELPEYLKIARPYSSWAERVEAGHWETDDARTDILNAMRQEQEKHQDRVQLERKALREQRAQYGSRKRGEVKSRKRKR